MHLDPSETIVMTNNYQGPERRVATIHLVLTEEHAEKIAEKAAEIAVKKMADEVYKQVGKGVINKALWITGALATGLYFWAKSHGYIK